MNDTFRGIIPPVVTPLTASGEIDTQSLTRSINRMIDAGVHGLFVLGSSGAVAFHPAKRRELIIRTAIEAADHRVPVLVGCIDMETDRVLTHAHTAAELGADAIVATAPFYALGGLKETERHFRRIHAGIDLPLFAYDIPVCVHTKLPAALLINLARDGVLTGVKDSSGDDVSFRFLARDNEHAGHPLTLLTGHEVVVDGAYLSGADGCVPGLGNIDPHGYVRQWDAYQRGDWEQVRSEQNRLTDLMRIVFADPQAVGYGAGVGSFATAMALLGVFETNRMPEPVATQGAETAKHIAAILTHAGLTVTRDPQTINLSSYLEIDHPNT